MYFPYSRYLARLFGGKTYKLVVSSGLSCPTRDGKISHHGCAFCDLRGSASYFGKQNLTDSITAQLARRLPAVRERFGAEHFLAYFQSYTNTYSDVRTLRALYEEALAFPGIEGLAIGTRPDCLANEVLALLNELSQRAPISLDLGVQSFENPTLDWLKRGHDKKTSMDALDRLQKLAPKVHTCVHLIFGSPTDSPSAPSEAARILNRFGVQGAKPHQLMVLQGSELGRLYATQPFPTLSLEEYGQKVLEFIENLSPEIYLERLCATATHAEECLAPEWSRDRWGPHNQLRDFLASHGCKQGFRLKP